MCAIALVTGRGWTAPAGPMAAIEDRAGVRGWMLAGTLLILFQLVVAATMRHQHAGLAIPDFPLAHGSLWPDTSAEAIARYNQQRIEVNAAHPITAGQVRLHMVHRLGAVAAVLVVVVTAVRIRRAGATLALLRRWANAWCGLLVAQFFLGVATIWSNKSADIATAHVALGALSLATGSMMVIISRRFLIRPAPAATVPVGAAAGQSRAVAGSR